MALRGSQPAILQAIDESQKDPAGYVSDEQIARQTRIAIDDVKDWLTTLEDDGLVSIARRMDGFWAAMQVTGRIEWKRHQENLRRSSGNLSPADLGTIKIVPSLKSFDENDANVFPHLLPDFDGGTKLPKSIAFWKDRIEGQDPNRTFRVGVISGLSGCGKSSLVKAGLLPRLGSHVLKVFLSASAQDTEERLLQAIQVRCPQLPTDKGLAESLAILGEGQGLAQGQKILIILDQFEQWLVAWQKDDDAELSRAFRHCDGKRVQALLLVRKEYLQETIDLLARLGTDFKFDSDRNARWIEAFARGHAKDVLVTFGRGSKDIKGDLSPEQERFLDVALDGLLSDGKYLAVRLALFAQVFKGRPWTSRALERVGGAEGVGVAFLEETFGVNTTNPDISDTKRLSRRF